MSKNDGAGVASGLTALKAANIINDVVLMVWTSLSGAATMLAAINTVPSEDK